MNPRNLDFKTSVLVRSGNQYYRYVYGVRTAWLQHVDLGFGKRDESMRRAQPLSEWHLPSFAVV